MTDDDEAGRTVRVAFEVWVQWEVIRPGESLPGWRGRLAAWLRRLSNRLDGSVCVAVTAGTDADLTAHDAVRCLEAGLRHGGTLWTDLAREAATDEAMREACPELYDEAPHG